MIEFQFQVCRNQRSISQISVKGNGGAGSALFRPSLFQNNKHSRFHLPFSHNSNPLPSKRFSPATHFPNSLSQFQKLLKVFSLSNFSGFPAGREGQGCMVSVTPCHFLRWSRLWRGRARLSRKGTVAGASRARVEPPKPRPDTGRHRPGG